MATWGSINLLHPMYYVAGLDWPEYDFPEVFNPGGNGLVSAFLEPGILVVHPGTFSGRVTLGLDVVETAPSVDEASWDEIVEVSLVPLDVRGLDPQRDGHARRRAAPTAR